MTATQNDGFTQTTATGGETTIDFDFLIYGKDDIAFYETDLSGVITLLLRGTDYSIADGELLDPTGGEIVLDPGVYPAGATAGHKFTCISDIAETRSSDFQQGGDFFAQTLNTNLDRLTRVTQQLRRDVDKKAGLPVDSTLAGITFTDAPQDGYGVIWDGVLGNFRNTASSLAVLEGNAATVAGSIASVNTVASNIASVNTVAGISANVTTVAGIAAAVSTVAGISAAVSTVAGIDTEVAGVYAIAAEVVTVAGIAAAVVTVAANDSDITTVANNLNGADTIGTVAGLDTEIAALGPIAANITTVAGISANVTTVAGISGNVTTVAGIAANVTTVAGISANVTTVAGISAAVSTVATNIADVNTAATNIAAIIAAPAAATEAEHWAIYPEDSLVPEGNGVDEYSAYHWAQKAAAVAVGNGAALSVLGVTGNATAARADITAGTDHQVLRRSGTSLTFGAVNLAQAAAVTGILPTANGGTANGFFTVSGPASSAKTYTFPNATCTVLTTNAAVTVAQGGTGVASTTAYAVICGGTTSTGALQSVASVGTAGQVLTSNGAGALPTFQDAAGGGWVPIITKTGNNDASVDFVNGSGGVVFDGTYKAYAIVGKNVRPGTDNTNVTLAYTTNGSSWSDVSTGNGTYIRGSTLNGRASFMLFDNAGNNTNEQFMFTATIADPAGTSRHKNLQTYATGYFDTGQQLAIMNGIIATTSAVVGIRVYATSGNIYGEFTLYGLLN